MKQFALTICLISLAGCAISALAQMAGSDRGSQAAFYFGLACLATAAIILGNAARDDRFICNNVKVASVPAIYFARIILGIAFCIFVALAANAGYEILKNWTRVADRFDLPVLYFFLFFAITIMAAYAIIAQRPVVLAVIAVCGVIAFDKKFDIISVIACTVAIAALASAYSAPNNRNRFIAPALLAACAACAIAIYYSVPFLLANFPAAASAVFIIAAVSGISFSIAIVAAIILIDRAAFTTRPVSLALAAIACLTAACLTASYLYGIYLPISAAASLIIVSTAVLTIVRIPFAIVPPVPHIALLIASVAVAVVTVFFLRDFAGDEHGLFLAVLSSAALASAYLKSAK